MRNETPLIQLFSSGYNTLRDLGGGVIVGRDFTVLSKDNGLGLLQEVKRRNAGLPVIMVTAYGDDERRRKASE